MTIRLAFTTAVHMVQVQQITNRQAAVIVLVLEPIEAYLCCR
jgi:hypothetical protein